MENKMVDISIFINDIIKQTRQRIEEKEYLKYMGLRNTLKEICTLHINCGRQSGHTSSAIKLIKEYDGVMFVHNESHKRNLLKSYNIKPNENRSIFTHNNIVDYTLKGTNIFKKELIIIDNYMLFNNTDRLLTELYGKIETSCRPDNVLPIILFLGA